MQLRMLACLSRGSVVVLLLPLAMMPSVASAQSVYSPIEDGALFPHWRAQVERMVATGGRRPINNVCVVGWREKADREVQQAYVVWPEQHRLITWMPSNDPNSLSSETHVLDLTKDVVANERFVNGSTYLVTRAWVATIERKCRAFGTELMIRSGRG